MKKIVYSIILLFSFSLIAGCGGDKAVDTTKISADAPVKEKIRIGVEGAYPPFSQVTSDGKLVGFDIDIAHILCANMNADCELITQDRDGIIPALLAKKYDAIVASMSMTDEHKKKVAFTHRYYQSPARFIHKKGASDTISKEGLAGKNIGAQRGTVSDKFITGEFGEGVTIKRYDTQEEAYLDLKAGGIEMVFADAFVLLEFLGKEEGKNYEFIGKNYTDQKYFGEGIGIALRQEDTVLRDKFNTAIGNIRKNGAYEMIREKYFEFDIYGK
jgi:arginine/ornithine transport system substrate-binding protein